VSEFVKEKRGRKISAENDFLNKRKKIIWVLVLRAKTFESHYRKHGNQVEWYVSYFLTDWKTIILINEKEKR